MKGFIESKKDVPSNGKKTKGRVRIEMKFIHNKLRRYTTFSKRKTGIMKKAYELATLTGTQVLLLVASETGHVYTYATTKLNPMIASEAGKALIQTCLNLPDSDNLLVPVANGNAASNGISQPSTNGSGGNNRHFMMDYNVRPFVSGSAINNQSSDSSNTWPDVDTPQSQRANGHQKHQQMAANQSQFVQQTTSAAPSSSTSSASSATPSAPSLSTSLANIVTATSSSTTASSTVHMTASSRSSTASSTPSTTAPPSSAPSASSSSAGASAARPAQQTNSNATNNRSNNSAANQVGLTNRASTTVVPTAATTTSTSSTATNTTTDQRTNATGFDAPKLAGYSINDDLNDRLKQTRHFKVIPYMGLDDEDDNDGDDMDDDDDENELDESDMKHQNSNHQLRHMDNSRDFNGLIPSPASDSASSFGSSNQQQRQQSPMYRMAMSSNHFDNLMLNSSNASTGQLLVPNLEMPMVSGAASSTPLSSRTTCTMATTSSPSSTTPTNTAALNNNASASSVEEIRIVSSTPAQLDDNHDQLQKQHHHRDQNSRGSMHDNHHQHIHHHDCRQQHQQQHHLHQHHNHHQHPSHQQHHNVDQIQLQQNLHNNNGHDSFQGQLLNHDNIGHHLSSPSGSLPPFCTL